jgi:hypothetical protein
MLSGEETLHDHSFETPKPISMRLHIPSGSMTVTATDGGHTTVRLEPLQGGDREREFARNVPIELREGPHGPELHVEVHERTSLRSLLSGKRIPDLRLEVQAPTGSSLDASTASADVETRGRLADATVASASGDIVLEHITGDARVKTASGDLEAGEIGGLMSFATASGDMRVERLGGRGDVKGVSGDVGVGEAAADLSVQTVSGDQEIGCASQGQIALKSVSGDVVVGILPGAIVELDVNTVSGALRSELDVSDVPPAGDGPRIAVRGRTVSGDVLIRRAPAPART